MKIRAMVVGSLNVREVPNKEKPGENYTFRTIKVLDLDSPEGMEDLLELDVHQNSMIEAQGLSGKTVVLNVYFKKNKRGDLRAFYGGQQVAAASNVAKAA
jgi:hypothetical protein